MKHYNIPIFIPHLACPFRCIFCDQKIISAQKTVPTPQEINVTIRQYLSTIPRDAEVEIAFFGGSFTAIDKDLQYLYLHTVQPFLQKGQIKHIRISTRPDCIDQAELNFLRENGVGVIELGIQSFCDAVLMASKRGYRAETAVSACNLIKENGFKLGIQLMPGLPGDNWDKMIATTERTIALQPDMVRIYPTVVLAGTRLAEMMTAGEYRPLNLTEAIEISLEMFLRFQKNRIEVIRLGLHNGEDLQDETNIMGGAYHPALGELVEQAAFYKQTVMAIKNYPYPLENNLVFKVNKKDISKFIGYKKQNIINLKGILSSHAFRIKGGDTPERNWISINQEGFENRHYVFTRPSFLEQYWR